MNALSIHYRDRWREQARARKREGGGESESNLPIVYCFSCTHANSFHFKWIKSLSSSFSKKCIVIIKANACVFTFPHPIHGIFEVVFIKKIQISRLCIRANTPLIS